MERMPSLDDWEKNWKTLKLEMLNAEIKMPAVVQVDFHAPAVRDGEATAAVACQAGR